MAGKGYTERKWRGATTWACSAKGCSYATDLGERQIKAHVESCKFALRSEESSAKTRKEGGS